MNNSPITSKIKTEHINLKQNWRVAAITATSCINLICDMALVPSEIKSPLYQQPTGRYPPEDTTADSREDIE